MSRLAVVQSESMSVTTLATGTAARERISRRWLRIIPVALVMYTIAFIDRTNISLALPRISRDLGLDPAQAGNVAGIFYWGYLALQIPGGHLAKYWSPKKFISVLLVFWAVCAVGCGFARTYHEMLILRLMLGVAESGVFPATLILISHWFSKAERARANALWLLCLPGAVIVSSPFSGWMLDHWNWRWMLIAEGALPFVWLIIWLAFIQDHPSDAKWLPEAEREQVVATLRAEAEGLESGTSGGSFLSDLMRPQVFLLAAVYFCFVAGQMGLLIWLPSAMAAFKRLSGLTTGFLFTLPYIVAAIGLIVLGTIVGSSSRATAARGVWDGVRRMLFAPGGGGDFAFDRAGIFVCVVERHWFVWTDGAVLGDPDGDIAAADCWVGDGDGKCAGEPGRVFRSVDHRVSE